jgi:hypothetical protein
LVLPPERVQLLVRVVLPPERVQLVVRVVLPPERVQLVLPLLEVQNVWAPAAEQIHRGELI